MSSLLLIFNMQWQLPGSSTCLLMCGPHSAWWPVPSVHLPIGAFAGGPIGCVRIC